MIFKKIYIYLFIISIIGLAIVQYQYLKIGLNLARAQFNQKIGQSINEVRNELQYKNQFTFLVGKAITKDDSYFKLSLDSIEGASDYFMNDFLKDKLLKNGIKTDFTYVMYTKDSTYYLKSFKTYTAEDNLLKYPIVLEGYLPTLINKRLILELQFKNLHKYFLFQLNGLTIPSFIFLGVIIFVIFWVLKSFYWQRNLITTTNEFINNLTHELKTPVFSIGVASKILEDKVGDNDKELVKIIRSQVDKLKLQIDKVLELASIESRKAILKKSVIDFKPILIKLISEFKELSSIENIDFIEHIQGDQYMLNCEPLHLENAIDSLLENAKKYSKEQVKIVFSSYKENGNLIISIKDKGIGLSKEDINKIFDKYYRVSSGDIHNVKGYGLGLNYVKRIVGLHNGDISVNSTLGRGSEFIISLPLYK